MAHFQYLNVNPQGEKINDCVTRAISYASKLPYETIRKKLFHTAKLLDCQKLCPTCYSFAIQEVLGGIPVNCNNMTVEEFADLHKFGIYLVRMEGHISVIDNNCVIDIFDCRNCNLTNAWKMK